jgi:hypothetical protein
MAPVRIASQIDTRVASVESNYPVGAEKTTSVARRYRVSNFIKAGDGIRTHDFQIGKRLVITGKNAVFTGFIDILCQQTTCKT